MSKIPALLLLLVSSVACFMNFGNKNQKNIYADEPVFRTSKSIPAVAQNPVIVNDDSFETPIVADIVITESPYNADPTGKLDATQVINDAITSLNNQGGGTIYFPKGKYRITSPILVNNYVTLIGSYVDPDKANGDYGTVIIADVPSSTDALPGLFRLRGSSGVIGMTIWYPGQAVDDIRPFPYTFEIMGGAFSMLEHMQFTIRNVTLINSFLGVAASRTVNPNVPVGQQDAHENLVIENLKGTVLKFGINSVNESDIGYFKNIVFNSSYWANAKCFRNTATKEEIEEYTLKDSCGLMLGDLEWSPYYDISVSGFKTGIHIIHGTRIQPDNPIAFMGGFYNLDVQNCDYGLVVDDLYVGWGMLVTHSQIKANLASVVNNAPVGYVRLTDVDLEGEIYGRRIFTNDVETPDLETKTPQISRPNKVLYDVVKDYGVVTDATIDATEGIQKALNDAGANGGGIVYLRAGYYRVENNLIVPENVQLRGCSSVANRDNLGNSSGTIIFSFKDQASGDPQNETAFITVNKNSGIYGLRICYPNNNIWLLDKNNYEIKKIPFTIRLLGNNSYCLNVGLIDSYNGVEVLGNNSVVKDMPCLFFNVGVSVKGAENVHIENVFSNATIATQSSLASVFPSIFKKAWLWKINSIWNYYNYTETHTTILSIENSTGINVMSVFTYCSAYLLKARNSQVTLNGCGGDRMYENGFILNSIKSNVTFVNILKYHCFFSNLDNEFDSSLNIFGRMNLDLGGVPSTFETDCNVFDNVECDDVLVEESDGVEITYEDVSEWKSKTETLNPLADILK